MQIIQYKVVRDIALDANGDWLVQNGDLQLIGDDPAIVQAVTIALEFFQGEWYLDENAGLPYFQSILTKGADANLLTGFFRNEILGVPGVTGPLTLNLTFDSTTRKLTVTWQAVSQPSGLTIGASTQLQLPGGTA